jgi:hypothetical protein
VAGLLLLHELERYGSFESVSLAKKAAELLALFRRQIVGAQTGRPGTAHT